MGKNRNHAPYEPPPFVPIVETIYPPFAVDKATDEERDQVISLILEKLGMEAVRTNKTKHGNIEVKLVSVNEAEETLYDEFDRF